MAEALAQDVNKLLVGHLGGLVWPGAGVWGGRRGLWIGDGVGVLLGWWVLMRVGCVAP